MHKPLANLRFNLRFKSPAIAVKAVVLSYTVNALQTIASVDRPALAAIVIIRHASTPYVSKPSNRFSWGTLMPSVRVRLSNSLVLSSRWIERYQLFPLMPATVRIILWLSPSKAAPATQRNTSKGATVARLDVKRTIVNASRRASSVQIFAHATTVRTVKKKQKIITINGTVWPRNPMLKTCRWLKPWLAKKTSKVVKT